VTKIVVEIPAELKPMVEPIRAVIDRVSAQVARSRRAHRVGYEGFEGEVASMLGAVECAAHAVALSALDIDAPKITIDGVSHHRVGRYEAGYKCRAGAVSVMRSLYRPEGERNVPTVTAVSLRAGTIEDEWLPGTARQMAHLLQQGPSREAEVTAQRLGQLPYSRSSFERLGHAVGAMYIAREAEISEQLIETYELPPEAFSVSASLDRVSVPMEEPRPRPVGRPRKGAAKNPVARVHRMAYCGTVTLHDGNGAGVHTIRYGGMPASDPHLLAMRMAADVLSLRAKKRALSVSILCDGAPEMWNLLDGEIEGAPFGEVRRTLDFWHATAKLALAAQSLHGESEAKRALNRWKHTLLHRVDGAQQILDELIASGGAKPTPRTSPPVHEAITYLRNNLDRMDYARARRAGLPIGSGNVEATCKSLFACRLKRGGARWKTQTGEEIIQLRALSLSDRWDAAMDLLFRRPPVQIRVAA